MTSKKPCMLMILDGWGLNEAGEGNAVQRARTPFLDRLLADYPHTTLACSGDAVGLPAGVMGNSEVGHLNIGAGRIVYQDLLRINRAIQDGRFFDNPVLSSAISAVAASGTTLHLMGLLSDGGVHSHISHLFALLKMAKEKGVRQACVHAILDGRDTPPTSGLGYLKDLQQFLADIQFGRIASVCGRFYAMDRDKRWERVAQAYRLYTSGDGRLEADALQAVETAYAEEQTDEFMRPIMITDNDQDPLGIIENGDGLIFFNFRADRAREITEAFTAPDFKGFDRNPWLDLCSYTCMTLYDEAFDLPLAFPPVHLDDIFGEVISRKGLHQLRIAETEKYAHVTYFFNGGEEKPFPHEDRCLVPSPREVKTYDQKPEMSALKVTDEVIERIKAAQYDVIILNFANMDMVGHTGVLEAAVQACETIDDCVRRITTEIRQCGGVLLITADHGNAEQMVSEDGQTHTAHTTNPVRLILVDDTRRNVRLRKGILGDIAPTMLDILGIAKPEQMTGNSLIEN